MYIELKFLLFHYCVVLYNAQLSMHVCAASPLISANDKSTVIVEPVPFGGVATLSCHSNDQNHTFLYWHLSDQNTIVGPGNSYNRYKYQYEVLSGNLTIQAISDHDRGLYNCVSRGVRKDDYNIRSIRVIVLRDWDDVYEHDAGVNLVRVLVVLIVLTVLAAVGYAVYRMWRDRFRNPRYLVPSDDEEEDDSGEEIFRAPGTSGSSRSAGNIVLNKSTDNFDSPGISTDFKSILDTANNK